MDKNKAPIPKHFKSEKEAGKFWDTHSAGNYRNEMEEIEIEFDVRKRIFLVPVEDRIYQLAKKQAELKHRTLKQVINSLLNRELAGTSK